MYADINPLHWGGSNSLAVGLGAAVYIWNAETGSINELHRLPFPGSYVTSLQWDARGRYLAIGTSDAEVQVSVAPNAVTTLIPAPEVLLTLYRMQVAYGLCPRCGMLRSARKCSPPTRTQLV